MNISFLKFQEFSELIEYKDEYFIQVMTEKTFGCDVETFAKELQKDTFKSRFKFDVSFTKAGRLIDLETLLIERNFKGFFELVLKKKYFWQKIDVNKLSYQEGTYIIQKFYELIAPVKEQHEWIYNPPFVSYGGGVTQGSIERDNFTKHYGSYIELVYLIANCNALNFKQVYEMDYKEFLFLGEYLLRKKYVEALK